MMTKEPSKGNSGNQSPETPSTLHKTSESSEINKSGTANKSPFGSLLSIPKKDQRTHHGDLNSDDSRRNNSDEAEISEEDDESSIPLSSEMSLSPRVSILTSKSPTSSRDSRSFRPASKSQCPSDAAAVSPIEPELKPHSSSNNSSILKSLFAWGILVGIVACLLMFRSNTSDSSSNDKDWRLMVDPDNRLPSNQRNMVRASLKPILDKSSTNRDEGISTLLILSSNEEVAAELGRCLLQVVNHQSNNNNNNNQISAEINLQKHHGGKLTLDSELRTLLSSTDGTRAVLLRHIGDIPIEDAFSQLRLLFAYCDGENPVIPHRLFIMTATSEINTEDGLRQKFKNRWPQEHDFVDALMSRISGHTIYLAKNQQSIC